MNGLQCANYIAIARWRSENANLRKGWRKNCRKIFLSTKMARTGIISEAAI